MSIAAQVTRVSKGGQMFLRRQSTAIVIALPMWMLLSAAFGFIIGDAFGDTVRHRKCLERANQNAPR